MVCDLQGVFKGGTFTLSDPAIISSMPIGGLLGPTDTGAGGMNAFFFKSHKYNNEYC
jgi:hypothetical protein